MPAYADRVLEITTTAPGTGPITLDGGALPGTRTFASAFPNRPVLIGYSVEDSTGSIWEIGKGTLNS